MKKVLLSSVAALAVFAAAAPVFAENEGAQFGNENAPVIFDKDGNLTPEGKAGLDNVDAETTKAKIEAAGETVTPKLDENGKPIPGEFVVSGPAKDAKDVKGEAKEGKKEEGKAPAAAGQKALPKTSAVK